MNTKLNQLKFKALVYSEMNMYDVTSIIFDNKFEPDIVTVLQEDNQLQYLAKELCLCKYLGNNHNEQEVYEYYTLSTRYYKPTLDEQWVVINWNNVISVYNCGSKILYKNLSTNSMINSFYCLGFIRENFEQMIDKLRTQIN